MAIFKRFIEKWTRIKSPEINGHVYICHGCAVLDLWLWRGYEEIAHIQGQRRSPSKTLGTGAAATRYRSNSEEIHHVQGQRSPSKMVGGENLH